MVCQKCVLKDVLTPVNRQRRLTNSYKVCLRMTAVSGSQWYHKKNITRKKTVSGRPTRSQSSVNVETCIVSKKKPPSTDIKRPETENDSGVGAAHYEDAQLRQVWSAHILCVCVCVCARAREQKRPIFVSKDTYTCVKRTRTWSSTPTMQSPSLGRGSALPTYIYICILNMKCWRRALSTAEKK